MGYTRHVSYFKKGTANTAVQSHAGRLFALHDASFPFEIASDPNTGKMSSVGYFDYNEQLKNGMTGHPKADPNNGELIFFGYDMFKPFASVTAVSKFGEIIYSLPLYQLDRCVMMHDFAITKNYVLVCNLSLAFTPMNACSNMIPNTPFKSAFEFDTSRPARIGLLPRDKQLASEENIRWFNILPAFFFHVFNAWEEQDTQSGDHIIKLIACRVNDDSIDIYDVENLRTTVYQWELNLSTGDVHEFPLLFKWTDSDEIKPIHADFPAMSDQKVGTKADIGYFTFVAVKPTYEYRGGFVKVDFRSQPYPTATPVYLPYGHFTTESSFVHRVRGGGGEEGTPREGDGYLVSMINNLEGDAECWILDADTLDIKFKGEIPQKVPLGFHGSYILEK